MVAIAKSAPTHLTPIRARYTRSPNHGHSRKPSNRIIGSQGKHVSERFLSLRKNGRANYAPAGRTLHILDFENLCAGSARIPEFKENVVTIYRRIAGVDEKDHVVVGVGPTGFLHAADAFPGCRLVIGRGLDGADVALLKVLEDVDWIAQRFDRVVIGSGDHCFSSVVEHLRSLGLLVAVIAREGAISRKLANAATVTVPLRAHTLSQ
jgi:hypothetical protein